MQVDLLDPDLYSGDPSPMYAWLRAEDPVHWDPINNLFGVSRFADIVGIEKDPELWTSAAGTRPMMNYGMATESMIDLDNPRHAEQRVLVGQPFTRRSVMQLEDHTRGRVNELIDRFAARGRADLVSDLAAPLPVSIICEKLGFPPEMWDRLSNWGDLVNNLGDGTRFHTPEKMLALMDWHAYGPGVLSAKAGCPADDLLSVIATATVGGCPRSVDAQVSEALLLLVGGSDTTRATISTGMWELSGDRSQWEYLREDPAARMATAVEEMVRWTTPVLNMCRTATRDTELHGVTIHAGQKVLLMYGAANRDEAVFADPERFDVTRAPNTHIGFGFGTHLCLGINLARMEVRVCFEELARRLPDIRVAPGFSPSYAHTAFVRGYTSLPVVFTPE